MAARTPQQQQQQQQQQRSELRPFVRSFSNHLWQYMQKVSQRQWEQQQSGGHGMVEGPPAIPAPVLATAPVPATSSMPTPTGAPMSMGQLPDVRDVPDVVAIPKPTGPRADFPVMPDDVIAGMSCNGWSADIWRFMRQYIAEANLMPGMTVEAFGDPATSRFFNMLRDDSRRVKENPWWILLGYEPATNQWQPAPPEGCYYLEPLADFKDSASNLMAKLSMMSMTSMSSVTQLCMTSMMSMLALLKDHYLPCICLVAWGFATRRTASKLMTMSDGIDHVWAEPKGNTQQMLHDVRRDRLSAC